MEYAKQKNDGYLKTIFTVPEQCMCLYSILCSLSAAVQTTTKQSAGILNGDHGCPSSSEDSCGEELVRKKPHTEAAIAASTTSDNMTSKDYYFDSYSHFGKIRIQCLLYHPIPTYPLTIVRAHPGQDLRQWGADLAKHTRNILPFMQCVSCMWTACGLHVCQQAQLDVAPYTTPASN